MEKGKKDLGAKIKYLESKRDEDYLPNLTRFARRNRISSGESALNSTKRSRKWPISSRIINSGSWTTTRGKIPDNVVAVTFKEEEGSFLMGVIAGSMTKTDKVGFIGGISSPLIKKFEVGFKAGVRAVNPKAKVTAVYAESFTDVSKGRSLASNMYNDGADIIYHSAGGVGKGLFDEVKTREKGKYWAIGVDPISPNWLPTIPSPPW